MLKEIARMTVILDGEEVYLVKRMINELREKGHDLYIGRIEIETVTKEGAEHDR
jgi:hypothetical protein